jgi:hypothetical protein
MPSDPSGTEKAARNGARRKVPAVDVVVRSLSLLLAMAVTWLLLSGYFEAFLLILGALSCVLVVASRAHERGRPGAFRSTDRQALTSDLAFEGDLARRGRRHQARLRAAPIGRPDRAGCTQRSKQPGHLNSITLTAPSPLRWATGSGPAASREGRQPGQGGMDAA